MADNIVDITFSNVWMNDGTATHTGSFSTATLAIDYTTMTVSGDQLDFFREWRQHPPGHHQQHGDVLQLQHRKGPSGINRFDVWG